MEDGPCHLPGCHSPAMLPTTGRLGLVTFQAQSHETSLAMTLSAPKLAENFTWTLDTLFFLSGLHVSGLTDIGRAPHLGLCTRGTRAALLEPGGTQVPALPMRTAKSCDGCSVVGAATRSHVAPAYPSLALWSLFPNRHHVESWFG